MNINKDQLVGDTIKLGNELYKGISKDRLAREYPTFLSFNSIMHALFGFHLSEDIIIKKHPNMVNFVRKQQEKSLNEFNSKILSEKEIYEKIFYLHSCIYRDSGIVSCACGGNFRNYSLNDLKDILFSYFSLYGNRVYQIVKKYFDEERIQLGIEDKNLRPNFHAFVTESTLLEKAYICVFNDVLNSETILNLAHEFGHIIDKELFLHPQQKKIGAFSDPFSEVPSAFFELGMCDFLEENRISITDPLFLLQNFYNEICNRFVYLFLMLKNNNLNSSDFGLREDFRNLFLYSMGYDIGVAMNELAREDREGYMKYFINLICSRNEADFITLLENGGINSDDFISGKILDRNIGMTLTKAKKRYKIID